MIILFTDFGVNGPYVGQMKAVLHRQAPGVPVIDLFADAPAFEPKLAAYLLAAYVDEFPKDSVFLCVVDPGVGSASRRPVVVNIDGRWFVGPDNGLFNVVATRAKIPDETLWYEITWQPEKLSNSFHGRDLFAPVAAQLASGRQPQWEKLPGDECIDSNWPQELQKVIYIDAFGNAMTGVRAQNMDKTTLLTVNGHTLGWARTFSDVKAGEGFWYENANGLVEISVNQDRADQKYHLTVGCDFSLST